MRQITIDYDDGSKDVIVVDDDGFTTHCVDFDKLDADLEAIANNQALAFDEEDEVYEVLAQFIKECRIERRE